MIFSLLTVVAWTVGLIAWCAFRVATAFARVIPWAICLCLMLVFLAQRSMLA